MRSPLSVAICTLVSLGALGSCGGGGSTTVPVLPTPPPVVRTVVLQGVQTMPADWHYEWWFVTTRTGNLDITVDWTYADSVVWVRLAQGKCDEPQLEAGQCQWLLQSSTTTPKPRVLTLPNAAPGQYTLYIYNGAKQPESFSYLVSLTG